MPFSMAARRNLMTKTIQWRTKILHDAEVLRRKTVKLPSFAPDEQSVPQRRQTVAITHGCKIFLEVGVAALAAAAGATFLVAQHTSARGLATPEMIETEIIAEPEVVEIAAPIEIFAEEETDFNIHLSQVSLIEPEITFEAQQMLEIEEEPAIAEEPIIIEEIPELDSETESLGETQEATGEVPAVQGDALQPTLETAVMNGIFGALQWNYLAAAPGSETTKDAAQQLPVIPTPSVETMIWDNVYAILRWNYLM